MTESYYDATGNEIEFPNDLTLVNLTVYQSENKAVGLTYQGT